LHVDTSIGAASIPIPKGLRAALASEHAEYWVEAVLKEYTSILSHDVFKVVRRCDCGGVPVLRCHLLFNIKSNADGSIDRFKSRLVVDGCAQTAGIDFDAIFATVVKFATFRMAIHLAAVRNYNVTGIDVSTAFLYGLIDKDVYMMMPEGLPRYDEHGNELICKLLKSIYGLRQASRIWYEHFFASMVAFGFVRSDIDPCLFIYKRGGLVIYALLWVDDLIMLDNCADLRNEFVNFLKGERKYALTDRGELTFVLGLTLLRDRAARTIEVGQKLYVDTACKRFGGHLDKSNLRSFDVPATKELADFSPDDCPAEGSLEQLEMQPLRADYLAMIGVLIWVSSNTHPEIAVATAVLSRFSINPAKKHFGALVRVFIYLQANASLTLTLGGKGENAEVLSIYTDSSHEESASLTGVVIVMGAAVIDWICRRQKSTMRSSTAAEAMANADGCDDGIFKKELAIEFGVKILAPIRFLSDSLFDCDAAQGFLLEQQVEAHRAGDRGTT
jgi:hypothetical protein